MFSPLYFGKVGIKTAPLHTQRRCNY